MTRSKALARNKHDRRTWCAEPFCLSDQYVTMFFIAYPIVSMKPVGAAAFPAAPKESLPARKNSLPRQEKFPAPIGEDIREFAFNALEPWRKLAPAVPGMAGHLQKLPAEFPADREFEDQARSPSPRLLVNLPPDQHAADFAGAGADFVELGVAQQPAGREIVDATSTSRVYTQHLESGQEQFQRAVVRFAADPARMLRAAWQRVTASTEFYASADCKRACTLTCSPWRAARRAFDDGTKWTFGEHYNTSGLGSV